jgi:hypothetical protein
MEKVNIYLDDEGNDSRTPEFVRQSLGHHYPEKWLIIDNYFDFIKYVDENLCNIGLVSFDHDISSFDQSNKEWTGNDAAKYLMDKCMETNTKFPDFNVHSMNTIGKNNIISDILSYLKHIEKKEIDWKYYNTGIINNIII